MIVDEPVGALSNLLAVMKRDVMDQPGVAAAQRLICTDMVCRSREHCHVSQTTPPESTFQHSMGRQ